MFWRKTERPCLSLVLLLALMLLPAGCARPTSLPATEVVGVPAPTAVPTSTAVPTGVLSPTDLAAFDFVVEKKIEAVPLAGLTLAIRWGSNPVYIQGYGYANIEESVPTEATTVYRIASLTKQFTAAAVMHLVEQGKITLDDPVVKHLPEAPSSWEKVTIRHLLTHTSGIPDPEELPRGTVEAGLTYPNTVEELIAALEDAPLLFEPGSRFKYGNSGYSLLGGIIERVSGLATEEYFQQYLFEPLGLDATFNCLERFEGVAQGYRISGRELFPSPSYNPSRLLGATGLCSTAGDLIKWQQALAGGRVVSEESYRQMISPVRLSDGTSIPYGYGLALDDETIIHGGGTPEFRSLLVSFPQDDLTIVLLSNTDVPASYSLEILASVIATRILAGSQE